MTGPGGSFPSGRLCSVLAVVLFAFPAAGSVISSASESEEQPDSTESPFLVRIDPERTTQFECNVSITGTLTTPARDGEKTWDLLTAARFRFTQRQLASPLSGPLALQAVRRYFVASTSVTVGKDHQTRISMPRSASLIQVAGSDTGVNYAPVTGSLSRTQLDLLQMPCDPLPCTGLLPSRDVTVGEKWNTDAWVVPLLAGLDAVTEQSMACELMSLNDKSLRISFTGSAEGAALGSASSVLLTGSLVFDRREQLIQMLECRLTEKRSPGPVSPGIAATVEVQWTQSPDESEVALPSEADPGTFEQPLVLTTPWRLILRHSREWHLFNQTERVLMLRQIRFGALVSQCNISAGVIVPPGEHTPDAEFRSDVEKAVSSRGGFVIKEETLREDNLWRVRRVQAKATTGQLEITWDYFLCASASGEQYSIVFSHSTEDAEAFGDEPTRLLGSLSLARRRPALPFR